MSTWTSEAIRIIKAILENLELNYTGGRSGHGRVYANRPKRIYGDEQLVSDEEASKVSNKEEGNVKISRAFMEDDSSDEQ